MPAPLAMRRVHHQVLGGADTAFTGVYKGRPFPYGAYRLRSVWCPCCPGQFYSQSAKTLDKHTSSTKLVEALRKLAAAPKTAGETPVPGGPTYAGLWRLFAKRFKAWQDDVDAAEAREQSAAAPTAARLALFDDGATTGLAARPQRTKPRPRRAPRTPSSLANPAAPPVVHMLAGEALPVTPAERWAKWLKTESGAKKWLQDNMTQENYGRFVRPANGFCEDVALVNGDAETVCAPADCCYCLVTNRYRFVDESAEWDTKAFLNGRSLRSAAPIATLHPNGSFSWSWPPGMSVI